MEKYVGLDVSMEEISVCVLDGGGNIVFEGKTSSQPDAMQAYKSIIAENTTLVLSTDSDLFKFLKGITPKGSVVPAQRSGDTR